MKKLFISTIWVVLLVGPNSNVLADVFRSEREVKMAEAAIFWALVTASSPSGRQACAIMPMACSDDRAELGLALLGSKNTMVGLNGLADLLRYRIDAGVSEDYTCYALSKGRRMIRPLESLHIKKLTADCKEEVKRAVLTNQDLLKDVAPEMICNSAEQIKLKARALLLALRSGKRCPAGDF